MCVYNNLKDPVRLCFRLNYFRPSFSIIVHSSIVMASSRFPGCSNWDTDILTRMQIFQNADDHTVFTPSDLTPIQRQFAGL